MPKTLRALWDRWQNYAHGPACPHCGQLHENWRLGSAGMMLSLECWLSREREARRLAAEREDVERTPKRLMTTEARNAP